MFTPRTLSSPAPRALALRLLPLVAALAGCGGATTATPTTPAGPARPQRVLRADVTAPAIPAIETRLDDGRVLILRGGRRIALGDGGVTAAALDFASPILGFAERADGALVLTADGVVYRLPPADPLGRPERLGLFERPRLSMLGATRGRLAVLVGDVVGDLYTSVDGTFERAPLPDRSVTGAVFTDEEHGCVLLFDGSARTTEDGGHSFRSVPGLSAAFALDLHEGQCRYHVGSAEEPRYQTVDETGRGVDYEPGEDDARDGIYPYRPAELFLSRGSMARIGRRRAVAVGPRPVDVQVLDLDDGRLLTAVPDALPGGCTLVDVGEAAVAVCTPEEGDAAALVTQDGETWTPLAGMDRALGLTGAQVYGSDDGQLAWTGPCEDDPAELEDGDALCVIRDLTTGAQVSLPIGEIAGVAIRGLAGDRILLESRRGGHVLGDLSTRTLTEVPEPDLRRVLEVELTSDGALVQVGLAEGGGRVAILTPPGGEPVRRTLPEGALDASFQTMARGVAAGRTMRDIFRTTDGGEHWSPMRVMLEGDPASTPLLDPERYLECHANYCLGLSFRNGRGRAFVLHPMLEDEAPHVLGAEGPDRLGDEPRAPLALPTQLRCELGEALPAPTRPALPRGATTTAFGDTRYRAYVDAVRRGRRVFHQVHWSGTDAEGEYTFSSRLVGSNAPAGASVSMGVLVASRRAALLNTCIVTEASEPECAFALVLPGGVPQPLLSVDPHEASAGEMVAIDSPREVFYVVRPDERGPVLFQLSPVDGTVSSLDIGGLVGEAFAGIASSSLGNFFVLTDSSARLWQAVVEHDQGASFATFAGISDARLGICRVDAATLPTRVRWPGQLRLRAGEEMFEGRGYAEVALTTTQPCIVGYGLMGDPTLGSLHADGSGTLAGEVTTQAGERRAVRCQLP